ncbi:spondin-2-like isoform X1 [Vanessa cardui]|uniref:spondin-2-like isoform X1 n=2 Tax=Vanessa cardui TaxID=171605 RepID=UPI001F14846D|nr:spondin-2-like isoform X1 [Vanessa cardui]
MYDQLLLLLIIPTLTSGQPGKCDQTPPQATVLTPSENKGIYTMTIDMKSKNQNIYRPDQTYVLIVTSNDVKRPFKWFMITVEDPEVDNSSYEFDHRSVDVGSLKTLDTNRQSRYSERCYNSVENTDNTDKYRVEIHWVSPKQSDKKQRVRLRAMVAENSEVWYVGENLTIELGKDTTKPLDSPPFPPVDSCNLCSEARYEVIFKGHWSRMSHPRNYPIKPDNNGYSHLVGASHSYKYILWQEGDKASPGLKKLAEQRDISVIEREIINAMSVHNGTRTLIRGKRRDHPYMFEPSHSLFRVDRIHHLFSLVIAMKPSPDWFLGVTRFELCTELGWLESHELPLYPWDAGTMDGISYESATSSTQPVDTVDRVAVGSFDKESPFYQMNLNDLKPFAHLQVRRLDVYPLVGDDCEEGINEHEGSQEEEARSENVEEVIEEPLIQAIKQDPSLQEDNCALSEWSEWSKCAPDTGYCGIGTQLRSRYRNDRKVYFETYQDQNVFQDGYKSQANMAANCRQEQDGALIESQNCFVDCL